MSKEVIVVSGASRGAGKGIALALAKPGRVIYISGRSQNDPSGELPGTLQETAAEIEARGAEAVAVVCDHSDDEQVEALFKRVEQEQGYLDILVNNAAAISNDLIKPGPFWQKSLDLLDIVDVGMRSHYVASYYAAPLLIKAAAKDQAALIVHTSSFGGQCYMHGPAYGAGKAGVDKMANDMAVDFRDFNVAVVSLWMGLVATERTEAVLSQAPDKYQVTAEQMESSEFPGLVINALSADQQLMDKSGLILVAAELALEYGIKDVTGFQPPSNAGFLGSPRQANPAIVE